MIARLLGVLLLLIPVVALPQGYNSGGPGLEGGTTLASFPLTTSGPLITEDANTVAHVYWQAGNVVNYALQSNSMSTSTSATSPWALNLATVATVAGAPAEVGGGTWAEVTSTNNTGTLYASVTTVSASSFTSSGWMAKASGTGYGEILAGCSATGTAASCSCTRSDGGTCTATLASPTARFCKASMSDLGTTPVRLSATYTCLAATTTPDLNFAPGQYGTATGTARVAGAMVEANVTAPSALVTTTSAAASNDYLVDTKGNSWTKNGVVGGVLANPFTTTRYGAGPFSDTNYYSLGTGADVLDFAGDFTVCVVFSSSTQPAAKMLVVNGIAGAAGKGWGISTVSGAGSLATWDAGTTSTVSTTANLDANGPNVICAGRSGTTQYVKMNAGSAVNSAGSKMTVADTTPATIGRRITPTGVPFSDGTIYEVYATSTAFSEATVTAIQQKVLGHFDGYSPLAVTRTTNATYVDPTGTLWTAAPGVARITTDGLLVEPARTNYALQNTAMSTSTSWTSPWTATSGNITVATVAGSPLGGTWAEATSTGSAAYQAITIASTSSLTCSTYAAAPTGTEGLIMLCACSSDGLSNAPTITGCVRSDGGTCTTSVVSTYYAQASAPSIGTSGTRLSMSYTCASATTAARIQFRPTEADGTTSGGPVRLGGAQVEAGTYATSMITVAGTAVARNADQVSATVPAVPSKWCVAVTAKPEEGRAFDSGAAVYSAGAYTGANSFILMENTNLHFRVYDATPAYRRVNYSGVTSAAHRYIGCDTAGVLSLSVDGALGGTLEGVGTGLLATPPTTLYFGAISNGTLSFAGFLKNLKICKASKTKECP